MNNSLSNKLKQIASALEKVSQSPLTEAEIILTEISGLDLAKIYSDPDKEITQEQDQKIKQIIASRLEHIPLQYLLGFKWFFGNRFEVNDQVFIPRDDTEILVEKAFDLLAQKATKAHRLRVLDLCTGSGVVFTTLLYLLTNEINKIKSQELILEFVAADISTAALKLAEKNFQNIVDKKLRQKKLTANISVEFIKSDLFDKIKGKFDLIVSNPPYIPETDKKTWQKELNFEPEIALTSGRDGMDAYNSIIPGLGKHLAKHGVFLGEIHPENYAKLEKLAKENGFAIKPIKGLQNEIRFISSWKQW